MSVSELKGDHCPRCHKRWERTSDFERLHVYDAPFLKWEVDGWTMGPGRYWKVRCRFCGQISEIVISGEIL